MADAAGGAAAAEPSLLESCATECLECARICAGVVAAVLDGSAGLNTGALILPLLDTIDSCYANATLLTRRSPLHPDSCALCAAACANSADACMTASGRLRAGTPLSATLITCARVCRRCASACLYFVGQE